MLGITYNKSALRRSVANRSAGGNFCAAIILARAGSCAKESLRLLVLGKSRTIPISKIATEPSLGGVIAESTFDSWSGYLRGGRLMLERLINHCSIIFDLKRH